MGAVPEGRHATDAQLQHALHGWALNSRHDSNILHALILVLLALLVLCVSSAPLVRTLSIAIDTWADSVQGKDAGLPG